MSWQPMLVTKKPPMYSDEQWLSHIESHLPLIVQPKYDGIRCVINSTHYPNTRQLKKIPNKFIRRTLHELMLPFGCDGEIVTYDESGKLDGFNEVSSKVMSEQGTPSFKYIIFDYATLGGYNERMDILSGLGLPQIGYIDILREMCVYSIHNIEHLLTWNLTQGYEGIILRKPNAPYKYGRPTLKESFVMAIKPFETSEAIIIDFVELMHYDNI